MDSLKVLDPEGPIREADIAQPRCGISCHQGRGWQASDVSSSYLTKLKNHKQALSALRLGASVMDVKVCISTWGCTMNKCPKCDALFTRVNLQHVEVDATQKVWNGVSYNCPFCHSSLGVSIDPIAIKSDIIADLLKALGHK